MKPDPLIGFWDTGPVPIAEVRNALAKQGYSTAEANKIFNYLGFKDPKQWESNFHFLP